MKWLLCKLFGHRPVFDRNEKAFTSADYTEWWHEFSKCSRCGQVRRELVASPRG
jgi:hypothetical protein